MGLFNKNKANFENPLKEISIVIEGQSIIPVWNEKVLEMAVDEINHLPMSINESKYMNIHQTNFFVFYTIRAGFLQKGLEFNYRVSDLFFHIDFQDYLNVLLTIQNTIGDFKGIVFQN